MKKINLFIGVALLATSPLALAKDDGSFFGFTPSVSAALTTDYIWRGVSQTANAPALQGSFDLAHESGAYIGIWGSNIEFRSVNKTTGDVTHETSLELDIYGGFSNEIELAGFGVTYDLGWLRYEYPTSGGTKSSASTYNFNELYAGLAISPIANLNLSAYYYYGLRIENTNAGDYRELALDYTLPNHLGGITVLASGGQYDVVGGGDDYWNWKIGVAKEIAGFNVELAYTETDDTGAGNSTDDGKFVATISREFGAASNGGLALPNGFESSATVALTTDYIWRGVSQTANAPAVQGSFDITHESGAYLGVWGSNVEFAAPDTSLELDIYAGFSGDINLAGQTTTYDFGWLRYEYPTSDGSASASGWNFNELYLGLATSPIQNLDLSAYYYYGLKIENTLPGEYTDVAMTYQLPAILANVTLLSHVGYYNQKSSGADDYWDWKLGIAKDFSIVNLELAYTDTDNTGEAAKTTDDAKVVATISASF